jgi:exodeoxyribonuclease V gamma subunit
LSAQQFLHISWQGRSVRDNSEKPPAVVVNQLLEHIERVYGARSNGQPWVLEHRLQPFHEAYFEAQQPQVQQLFSYAREWHVVHQPSRGGALESTPHQVLDPYQPERPFSVKHLTDFFREPARLFTQVRLQTYLAHQQLSLQDDESFALDHLERWQLLTQLFDSALPVILHGGSEQEAQDTLQAALAKLQRSGAVADGAAGLVIKQELSENAEQVFERVSELSRSYVTALPTTQVAFAGAQGYEIEVTFQHLRMNSNGEWLSLHVTPSVVVDNTKAASPRPKYAIKAWIEHLLLNSKNATHTQVVGREGVLQLAPMTTAQAESHLNTLLQWVGSALQQPLAVEFDTVFKGLKAHYKNWQEALASADFHVEHAKVAEFYDVGSYQEQPHSRKAVYLARFFPTYQDVCAAAHQQPFAEAIYRPLLEALVAASTEAE